MKKLFLLLAGGFMAFSANAQYIGKAPLGAVSPAHKVITPVNPAAGGAVPLPHYSGARTTATATCLAGTSSTFAGGTPHTLPAGWTAGIISGPGTWHWTDTASGSPYGIGVLNSTSASDGWMVFDSDSLGGEGSSTGPTPAGWLQSPVYNCSSATTVAVNFQEFFQEFQDSCFIWVGTTAGFTAGTYSVYPVRQNNTLWDGLRTPNPDTIQINVTGAAAGKPAVYVRFVYYGPPGGGYEWMVDDFCLSSVSSDDVAIGKSFMFEPEATAFNGSIFETPLEFVDSVFPITSIQNYGTNAEAALSLTAQIFEGTTSVYSQTSTFNALTGNANLAVGAFDSLAEFGGYLPTSVGLYTVAINATLAGDANPANNYDTLTFAVSDTTWMQNYGQFVSDYIYPVNSAASGSSADVANYQGVRFDVPTTSAGDTVSGFGVCFTSYLSTATNPGGTVSVQLYSATQSSTDWAFVASSVARPVTAADLSSTAGGTWAYFKSDYAGAGNSWAPFVLQPGTTYAAVVQVNAVTTDLFVYGTDLPNATGPGPDGYAPGFFGQSSTSNNDGGQTFGNGTLATGLESDVPMVRMYFGNVVTPDAVKNITVASHFGNAFPVPAHTTVSIPFTLAQSADVTATLTNTIGQVVATQQLANTASGSVTFNTAALAAGEYIYTVSANGERAVGQIVVTH